MSLDLSSKTELSLLSRLVDALNAVAEPRRIPFFLIGATARDVMMRHAHGVAIGRATQDVDFAVMVRDWDAFMDLRESLVAGEEFTHRTGPATHRLTYLKKLPLDIVPFGGVERGDRTFAWPPYGEEIFDCFGVDEAFKASVTVTLPHGVPVQVAPVAAQAVMKIIAWMDRKYTDPGRDAGDLFLFFRYYGELGHLDRIVTKYSDAPDFDFVEGGVKLLARDVLALLSEEGCQRLLNALLPEADPEGALVLASQSSMELEHARRLLEVFCTELRQS